MAPPGGRRRKVLGKWDIHVDNGYRMLLAMDAAPLRGNAGDVESKPLKMPHTQIRLVGMHQDAPRCHCTACLHPAIVKAAPSYSQSFREARRLVPPPRSAARSVHGGRSQHHAGYKSILDTPNHGQLRPRLRTSSSRAVGRQWFGRVYWGSRSCPLYILTYM